MNETIRVEHTRTAVPAGDRHSTRAPQHAGAEVEHALVREQLAVADVEGLVVDEQADDLAVGHVHDRLARLRVAVAGLGVRQRPQLVERVQVRAGQAERLAFVEVRAQARCGRSRARRPTPPGRGPSRSSAVSRSDQGSTVKLGCLITRAQQLGQVADDDVGAVGSQSAGLADAVDADDEAEAARPSRRDAGERVLEHRRLAGRDADDAAPARNVSGAGFPRRCSRSATTPSTMLLEELGDAGRRQHRTAVGARRDDCAPQAGVARRAHEAHRALVGLHALAMQHGQDQLVLAVAERR